MKRILITCMCLIALAPLFAQTDGISINSTGTDPDPSAMLDIQSADKGLLIPRMDSSSRVAITNPAEGLMVYDSTTQSFWYYRQDWEEIEGGDDLGDHRANKNLQTNGHWVSQDGDNEGIYVDSIGKVGIGTQAPSEQLEVNGAIRIGTTDSLTKGAVRFSDNDFEGYDGQNWKSFTKNHLQSYGKIAADIYGEEEKLDAHNAQADNGGIVLTMAPWQSFTAEETGMLSKVEIRNIHGSGSGVPVIFEVYKGEGRGGQLLFSGVSNARYGWSVLFQNKSIPVIAGSKYTISVVQQSTANSVFWGFVNGNPYPNGRSSLNPARDLLFRTYVVSSNVEEVTVLAFDTSTMHVHLFNKNISLDSAGNVGIGTTLPDTTLHLVGQLKYEDGSQASGHVLTSDGNGVASWQVPQQADNLGNHVATQNLVMGSNWLSGDGDNEGIVIDNLGNVGIGTFSPQHMLHLGNNPGRKLALYQNAAGTDFYGFGLSAATLELHVGSNVSEDPFMVLKSSGRVGIGTHIPQHTLDVAGGVAIGQAYAGNTTVSGPANGAIIEGNVGIGTSNPTKAKLEIRGFVNHQISGTVGFLNNVGSTPVGTGTINAPLPYSLYADNRIAASSFQAHSDTRIKHIQGISNSEADLSTLMQIEVTDYRLRDSISKGNRSIKKVIAQQVAEVYPQAVTTDLTEVVPDIYQRAEVQDDWVMLATDLQVGERVKVITEYSSEVHAVTAVEADRFQVEGLSFPSTRFDKLTASGSGNDAADAELVEAQTAKFAFVYGREVNDFHTVDYEAISMLNVSATQAQQRIIEAQQAKIEELEARLTNMYRLETRLKALETALSTP
ncbi:MAG: tail fiber domain-containing protein [Bacteroidota bacterium]